MISYRKANDDDFDFTFRIKTSSSKQLIEKIWGWDNAVQLNYHKNRFDPGKTKIIIYEKQEVGYISSYVNNDTLFIENILLDTSFQGKRIGTKVLLDTIQNAVKSKQSVELQVFKINDRAKKLYERLNFHTFEQTELHFKMRYEKKSNKQKLSYR